MSEERPILPASTVILLRDSAAGVQTFMMRRHDRSGFMGGATVFPGGKIDPVDAEVEVCGRGPAECAALLGLDDPREAVGAFVAAVRELHEEARVLLLRDRDGRLPAGEEAARLTEALDGVRDGHHVDARAHHALLRDRGLMPALDLLHPFARWLTPRIEPRRFDTFFFAAAAPPGQRAGMDGFETTAAAWCLPAEALEDNRRGGPTLLPPPTLHTLERLRDLPGDAATHIAALSEGGAGPQIEPHFEPDTEMGPILCLPTDPLHPRYAEVVPPRARRPGALDRFVLRGGRFSRLTA